MRTLVLTPDFPPMLGGIQLLVHRVTRYFTGLEPLVVASRSPGSDAYDRASELEIRRAMTLPGPRPLSTSLLNAKALQEGLRFRPEAILSAHIVTSPAAALLRKALGVPVVQLFHAKEIGARSSLAGFAARNADASVTVSRYTRDLVLAAGGPPDRIHCISPGVDIPDHPSEARAERPTVLTIARLEDRYKGHDVLVRAMALVRARVPHARWVVLGDGPLRPALEELATAHGLDAETVRFLGPVSDEARDAWLDRAHVFAMPSRLPAGGYAGEGFGIVYLEAGAHGLPVVAGDVGGALDAVVDGETGLLVDPTDHVAVADGLSRLLEEPSFAAELGVAGAARAARFAWPEVAGRIERLTVSLVRNGRESISDTADAAR